MKNLLGLLLLLFCVSTVSVNAQNCPEQDLIFSEGILPNAELGAYLSKSVYHAGILHNNPSAAAQSVCFVNTNQSNAKHTSKKADTPLSSVFRERWSLDETWVNDQLTEFTYINNERLNTIKQTRWSEGAMAWLNVELITYSYDIDGQLATILTQSGTPDGFQNAGRELFVRENNGNKISSFFDAWNGQEWVLVNISTSIYEEDVLVEGTSTQFTNGIESSLIRFQFEYDDMGRETLLSVDEWSDILQDWQMSGRRVSTYDELMVDIKTQLYFGNDDWQDVRHVMLTFNDRELLAEQIIVEYGPGLVTEDRNLYSYVPEFETPSEIIYQIKDNSGDWLSITGDFVTHDPDGDLLERLNLLYSGTVNGEDVWENIKRDMFFYEVATSTEEALPAAFLFNTYPNPSSGPINVQIQLEQATTSSIEIVDVLGRRVATLLNEAVLTGPHHIIWHPDNLPAGLYFIRFESDHGIQTKPITIIK